MLEPDRAGQERWHRDQLVRRAEERLDVLIGRAGQTDGIAVATYLLPGTLLTPGAKPSNISWKIMRSRRVAVSREVRQMAEQASAITVALVASGRPITATKDAMPLEKIAAGPLPMPTSS